ncbi:nickel/cobalt transporter [Klebsiella sp. BIGb0407]|uniref:nickel/cobalt transporter n=1 Tax=Klebsiella sp. BIGb0407 TaxID=2940603 RepID=UPI00216AA834|nr:nickel/cobalt transporter [Klebsiella sp. BIGb0407]MCS3431998.1 ABC-type nickel/cobalt efflux system permease component RcnA [Klebsiella sp. BIGb0407]
MPVSKASKSSSYDWRNGWPLLIFLTLTAGGLFVLWTYWPQILAQSTQWQRAINLELSSLLRQVAENPTRAGWVLLGVSFSYGVLHALGPGHGKIVITTWLATHPSKLKTSLKLTFAASLLQGLVAIGLVTILLVILQLPSRQLHLSSFWLEKGSYLLVGVLGLLLCLRAIRRLRILLRRKPRFHSFTPQHIHDEHCGCGHQHVPDPQQLAAGDDWRARLMVVISMGIRPCSGAIMVLLFSKVIGVFSWGVVSALAMALGTAITLSGLALLVHSCRNLAIRLSKNRPPLVWQQVGWSSLALAGGVILVVAAVVMWLSAQPVMRGLRPF